MSNQPIYLASPYSHTSSLVRELRWRAAEENTARLLNKGIEQCIFQPIVHCHAMAANWTMPTDFGFWMHYDLSMIECLPRFGILKLPGWELSQGVTAETEHATKLGYAIESFYPQGEFFEALQKLA
jgi:hypothetical protein